MCVEMSRRWLWLSSVSLIMFACFLVPAASGQRADTGNSCDGDQGDDQLYSDCRGLFEASFYIGLGIDTFAGSDTLSLLYRNPGASGQVKERAVGGLAVDTHLHHYRGGSDAIQSFVGVNYDLDKFPDVLKGGN